MTFDDYRDKILAALATLILSGVGYVCFIAVDAASRDEVKQMILDYKDYSLTAEARAEVQSMIKEAKESSYYSQDRGMIRRSIDDLYRICSDIDKQSEKNKEAIDVQTTLIWAELHKMSVELERIRVIYEMLDTQNQKKKEPMRFQRYQYPFNSDTRIDPEE